MMGEILKGESVTDWHCQMVSWRLTPQDDEHHSASEEQE